MKFLFFKDNASKRIKRFNMSDVYRARLQLVQGSDPLRFELIQAEKLTENFRGDNASFNQITGELNLPFVDITGTSDSISTYAVGASVDS